MKGMLFTLACTEVKKISDHNLESLNLEVLIQLFSANSLILEFCQNKGTLSAIFKQKSPLKWMTSAKKHLCKDFRIWPNTKKLRMHTGTLENVLYSKSDKQMD